MNNKSQPPYSQQSPIQMQSFPKNYPFSQTGHPQPQMGNVNPPTSRDPVQYPRNFDRRRNQDAEAVSDQFQSFGEQAVRRSFIKKVYSILMVQLVVTAAIISIFMFVEPVKMYVRRNRWILWTSLALGLILIIVLACCPSVRRKYPQNIIALGLFTVCEGVMLGTISSFYDVEAVLIAVGITAGVTLGLTLFAFQTKFDFTGCGAILFALLFIFIIASFIVGIVSIFTPTSQKYRMIGFGVAGAVVFSLYLVYDTQLLMGGKHRYSISPEEYIFAALSIYLDVLNIFLYILMIVGGARTD